MKCGKADSKNFKYAFCVSCEQGKGIKKMFPDWRHIRQSKRIKPDRISLRTFKEAREAKRKDSNIDSQVSGVGTQEIPKDAQRGGVSVSLPVSPEFSPNIAKLFDAELFIKAQTAYVFSLLRARNTKGAEERIALIKSELTAQGINHDVLKEGELS